MLHVNEIRIDKVYHFDDILFAPPAAITLVIRVAFASPCYSLFLCWHYLNVHWLCGPRSCARGLYRPDVDVYQKPLNSITSFSHQAILRCYIVWIGFSEKSFNL